MKMTLFLSLCLLIGCGHTPKKVDIPVVVVQKEQTDRELRRELKKLLRDCPITETPEVIIGKEVGDVAIDLANARKANLEECNKRVRKARARLDG